MSQNLITKKAPAPRQITTRINATELRWAHVSPLAKTLPLGWTLKLDWIRRTSPTAKPLTTHDGQLPPLPKPRAVGSIILINRPARKAWTKTFKVSSARGALVSLRQRKQGPLSDSGEKLKPHGFRSLTDQEFNDLPSAAQRIIDTLRNLARRR